MTTPNDQAYGEIRVVWLNFISTLKTLLLAQQDDRPLDQYFQFRDAVTALVISEDFLNEFESKWNNPSGNNHDLDAKVKEVLLLELRAFAPAVEVSNSTSNATEKKTWWRSMLGKASTTIGSFNDLVKGSPLLNGGFTVLKEAVDIFKG